VNTTHLIRIISLATAALAASYWVAPQALAQQVKNQAARAQGYVLEPAPAWVVPAKEGSLPKMEAASMHYRLIDTQIRADAKAYTNYNHVVRVPNDTAGLSSASQIELDFDPAYQTVALHHLEVIRGGQRTSRLSRQKVQLLQRETQLERQMYDGRVTLSMVLDDVRVGDQIDFSYSIRGANPVFDGKVAATEWMSSPRGPVALYQLRVLAPADRKIQHRAGSPDIQVESKLQGAWRDTVFRRDNVAQLRAQEGAPSHGFTAHQVQLSEFADWADVTRWGVSVFAHKAAGPLVDKKAAEIRAASPDKAAQLLAALNFVQKDVRYFGTETGMGTHRPAAPDKVMEQRFGDCKDKANLLVALLKKLDIPAAPVLVSTWLRSKVDQQLPAPLAFDHAITRVDLDGTIYWLDATRNNQTGPLDKRQTVGLGHGLVLAGDSVTLAALPTPFDTERLSITDTIRISRFADVPKLESRITYRGELADVFRDLLAQRGTKDLSAELSREYLKVYPKIQTVGDMRVENEVDDDAITFSQHFTIPDFWRFPEQRALQADVVHWGVLGALSVPKTQTRREPYSVSMPGRYKHKVVLELPEDVPMQAASQHFEDGDKHVHIKTSVEASPRRVEYSAQVRLGVTQIEPQVWAAYTGKLTKLMPRFGVSLSVPVLPQAGLDALSRDMKVAEEAMRDGRIKVITGTQIRALFKTTVLTAQLNAGRLPPALEAQALTSRGLQYDHLGRWEDAHKDYSRALQLAPDISDTQNAAAMNAFQGQNLNRTVEMADAVLQRTPGDAQALHSRALASYFKRDFGATKTDLEEMLTDRSVVERGYPLIWLSMAMRHAGLNVQALQTQYPTEQLPTDWPRPLVDLALGSTSVDAVIAAAKAAKSPLEPLCEAYFYIGEKYFTEGDTARAQDYWRKAAELGVVEYMEHSAAKLRLAGVGLK
jgi:lipoprotein NlpI/transglutaminase-like putative cysteine protease